MSDELILEASPVSSESFIYQAFASEGEGDTDRAQEFLQRRNDLLHRINEDDKMHNAMIAYEQECSEKTRDLVRQRRRIREANEKRIAGLQKHHQSKRKEVIDAAASYQKELEETFDEPKSKIRRKKATTTNTKFKPAQGESPIEGNGREEEEVDRSTEA